MNWIVKLLCKIPAFRRALVFEAFTITYVDTDEFAKLKYIFTDSTGKKWYEYIRPEWMKLTRYNEMQVRLQEIESRISRETLTEFAKTLKLAAEKKDLLTVARIMGELEERLNVLYDPYLLIKFLCGVYIREDQVNSAGVFNEAIEKDKYEQIIKDYDSGHLSFFFHKADLARYLKSSDGSALDLEIFNPKIVKNQMKEVQLFDSLLKQIQASILSGG